MLLFAAIRARCHSMSWYYAQNGKQLGPVSESEFQAAVGSGAITAETLVWREGLPEWKKYRDIGAGALAVAGPAVTGTFGSAACVECGQHFPQDEMVKFGEDWVCAGCKPQYVQKIKEGVAVGQAFEYAGFWIRAAAKLLDGVLLYFINLGVGMVIGMAIRSAGSHTPVVAFSAGAGAGLLVGIAYVTFFLGKFGATPGKLALKLKVIRPDGESLTYGRAFGRSWAEFLNNFTLTIGYIIAGWDPEKRALHDRIADTRVIRSR